MRESPGSLSDCSRRERSKVKHITQGLYRLKLEFLWRQSNVSRDNHMVGLSRRRSSCYAFCNVMHQQGRKEGLLVLLISPRLRTHTEGTLLSTRTELETSALQNQRHTETGTSCFSSQRHRINTHTYLIEVKSFTFLYQVNSTRSPV